MRVWIDCINDTYGKILGNLQDALAASRDFLLDWNTVVKSPYAMKKALDLRSLRRHPNFKAYVKEGREYLMYIGKEKLGIGEKDTFDIEFLKALKRGLSVYEEIKNGTETPNGILNLELTTFGKSKIKTGDKAYKQMEKWNKDLKTFVNDIKNYDGDLKSTVDILTHAGVLLDDAKALHNLPRIFSRAANTISQIYNALVGIYQNAVKAYKGAYAFIGNSFNFQWSTDELVKKAEKVLDFHERCVDFMKVPIPVCTCKPSIPPLKVSKRTENSLRVIWSAVPYAVSYKIECSTNGLLGQQRTVQGTSYTFTGLKEDTLYHMKIKVVTRIGESSWGGGCSARTAKSSDPNEIIGPIGADFTWHDEGTEDEPFMVIDGANWVYNNDLKDNEYKIYFENKSTATAGAQEITVKTVLPQEMDWSTFQADEISIGNEIYTLSEDCRIGENTWLVDQASTGEQIKIRFDFDAQTGEATWYLRSYVATTADNFPVSAYDGFLPPNDENHSGEGYIAYRVKYDSDLVTGDVVETNATIVFDTNTPIVTNTWLNTIDVDAPTVQLTGQPEQTDDGIALAWAGSDVGSGIAAYQVYVSENGGVYELWNTFDATQTSAVFSAENMGGHSYAFYMRATDGAGLYGESDFSETVTVEAVELAAPTLDVAVNELEVSASWAAVENASGYQFEYKAVGADSWTVQTVAGTNASFDGERNTTYTVRVKALGLGCYVDSAYSAEQTVKVNGVEITIVGKKVTVTWVDESPAADAIRYRVAGTARWTLKKLKAGETMFSFNAQVGTNYEVEVLLDQSENNVLNTSVVVLDQAKLSANKASIHDDTFQVSVTNYTAKNLAANAWQAILLINGTQTVLDIENQQGAAALMSGGNVTFDNGLFTFSEMASNTQYKVQVSFSDGFSVSTASSALNVKTLKAPYLAPEILSATAISDTSITVEWAIAYGKKSNTPAQKYTVQYSTDGVKWSNATTGATGNSFTIQRLKGGTVYQVRVLATKDNAFEASTPGEALVAETLALPKIALEKASLKDDTFQLNVTNYQSTNLVKAAKVNVTSDKLGTAVIELQNGTGSATFTNGTTVAFANGALTFAEVPSNTQQKVQVSFTMDACTTALSQAVTVKTTVAPYNKPVLRSAFAVSSTSITVEWETVYGKKSTVAAQAYTVQYSTDGVRWTNATTKAVGTSFTITKLKANTKYLVAVLATKDQLFLASEPSDALLVMTAE